MHSNNISSKVTGESDTESPSDVESLFASDSYNCRHASKINYSQTSSVEHTHVNPSYNTSPVSEDEEEEEEEDTIVNDSHPDIEEEEEEEEDKIEDGSLTIDSGVKEGEVEDDHVYNSPTFSCHNSTPTHSFNSDTHSDSESSFAYEDDHLDYSSDDILHPNQLSDSCSSDRHQLDCGGVDHHFNKYDEVATTNDHSTTKAAKKIEVIDTFFFPKHASNPQPQSKPNTIYFSFDPVSKQCSTHHGVLQSTESDFTDVEDELLLQYVSTLDTSNWLSIANKFTDKSEQQCKNRYSLILNSNIGIHSWTKFEDDILINYYWKIGPRWLDLSKFFKQHNATDIRNRCRFLLKNLLRLDHEINDFIKFDDIRIKDQSRPEIVDPQISPSPFHVSHLPHNQVLQPTQQCSSVPSNVIQNHVQVAHAHNSDDHTLSQDNHVCKSNNPTQPDNDLILHHNKLDASNQNSCVIQRLPRWQVSIDKSNISHTSTSDSFENTLFNILCIDDLTECKNKIINLAMPNNISDLRNININSKVCDLLACGVPFPKPTAFACFVKDCHFTASSEGMLRKHIKQSHNVDVSRNRDELINIISYMTFREISTIYQYENGDEQQSNKCMLFCHRPGCGYTTDRDSRIKTRPLDFPQFYRGNLSPSTKFWGNLVKLRALISHFFT